MTLKVRILVFSIILVILTFATVSASMIYTFMMIQQKAYAQGRLNLVQGQITASNGGKQFGGDTIGSYAIEPSGGQGNWALHVLLAMDKSPPIGKIYNGWLLNTKTNSYLNLGAMGQDKNLDFSQNTDNPFVYNQIVVSEEPTKILFVLVKPSKIIGGDELPSPPFQK